MYVPPIKKNQTGESVHGMHPTPPVKLKDALRDKLSQQQLSLLVRGYDVVGDIAITIIPPELLPQEQLIGDAILQLNKNIRVVAKRNGNYCGEYRTIGLKIIAGENRKETLHREHGVRLFLNPEKVYFSVRSGTERRRLAQLISPGEEVLVMFSGIGAFPLVLAKNSRVGNIIGVEKNYDAHMYALKNLAANRKIQNVSFIEGDVLDIVPQLDILFDRIIMPLPKGGEKFLDTGLGALKKGGWLHFYDFQAADCFSDSVAKVNAACQKRRLSCVESSTVSCGHCGPRTYRICVDARIS